MEKLALEYLRPSAARGFRFLSVPKELLENPAYSSLDYGAVILYARMLERAGLSARNEDKFTDGSGRLFIIYTVEQMERDIQRSHPTVIKLTRQLAEIGLIEKVWQGQGKPSKIYIKDFASVKSPKTEANPQEVKNVNLQRSKNLTSGSQEGLLLGVKTFYPIEKESKDLDCSTFHRFGWRGTYRDCQGACGALVGVVPQLSAVWIPS